MHGSSQKKPKLSGLVATEPFLFRALTYTPHPIGPMGWLRLVGSIKLHVSFATEPCKRDDILQKRPIISRRLLLVTTPK